MNRTAAIEDRFTIAPERRDSMCGSTCLQVRKQPLTLRSKVRFQPSSSISMGPPIVA
ncbi:hypothetical protein FMGBMHLM_0922 [Methylobacterium aerolatum]|nr:hypothetical protein FMGBMHLM_0922 [Methylobacterium aerolatum]